MYLAGNSQTAPMIFFSNFQDTYFLNYFIKNRQTTIALTFLTNIISGIGGVERKAKMCAQQFDGKFAQLASALLQLPAI